MKQWILIFLLCCQVAFAKERLLIGAPVRQKPEILKLYLEHLDRADLQGVKVVFLFIDDNDDPLSSKLLNTFLEKHHKNCHVERVDHREGLAAHLCDAYTHHWKQENVERVIDFSDRILEYGLENGYDYVLLVDSDVLLHPSAIRSMLDAKKEVVSNIYWTEFFAGRNAYPHAWMSDEYSFYEKRNREELSIDLMSKLSNGFLERLKEPGYHEVGGLGGCMLIARSVIEKGVRFARLQNVTFGGRHHHFCIRAAALDIGLFVDSHYPALHLFRESDLEKVEEFQAGFPDQKKAPAWQFWK